MFHGYVVWCKLLFDSFGFWTCLTRLYILSGRRINPTWFALDSSRGIETQDSIVFMRSTVLILDGLIYIPALLMFARTWQGTRSKRAQVLTLTEWSN